MLWMLFFMNFWFQAPLQEWAWSVHPESGFKILCPVTLVHEEKEVPTTVDKITYHQYHGGSLYDSTFSMAFVVDHYVLPTGDLVTDTDYLREFFETTIDQHLLALEGTLLYMDILSQSGQELCIWKGTFQNGKGVIRGHSILAGERYYGLQVFGWTKDKPDPSMSKFLDSFKLTGGSPP
jgi:hypothetical protein